MNTILGIDAETLPELCMNPNMQKLRVAEINAAGDLHPVLQKLLHLNYSEFGSVSPEIRSEDLLDLSYSDQSFDLAITSDVLEHVPDVERALEEIRRILKPNGAHIFSVPVDWSKSHTRRRAEIQGREVVNLLPASHHGAADTGKNDFLVFYEFGRDFVQLCERTGFRIELVKDRRNPSLVTFISWRKD